MENGQFNTDAKLLRLLSGGEDFRRLVDPEGITRDGVVQRLVHSNPGGQKVFWKLFMVFPAGDSVVVSGILEEEKASVTEVGMPDGDGFLRMETVVSPTVVGALGNLSGIPARLKRCLAPAGPETAPGDDISRRVMDFLVLEEDGLFWGVEGGSVKAGYRVRFVEFSVKYKFNEAGERTDASFCAKSVFQDGRVKLCMNADVYGLGSKTVVLDRNVGLGGRFRAECTRTKDGREYPSLTVAFDLNDRVPVFYTEERHEANQLGKLKVKSKR